MKSIFLLLAFLILCSFAPDPEPAFKLTLPIILAILGACYEAISRIIPTKKVWSIVGKILEVLTWFSNLLDRKRR
jgi:hypothetical protein